MSNDFYLNNPLIHQDRRLSHSTSAWVRSFACDHVKPLIICRGPIRKEAMDVFEEMGITQYGILLSEKDSIVYQNALAPELRKLTDPGRVHRVPDYSGANKEERDHRIQQIIGIAQDNGYNSIFAGYGFMAEDETMVAAMEAANLTFIGPCSRTVHDAGLKDEAKRTALNVGVSVTPGVDNATVLTLLKKHPDEAALRALADKHSLDVAEEQWQEHAGDLESLAVAVLASSYDKGVDLYTVDEMIVTLEEAVTSMFIDYPENRIRLKAISGGGGKGQRIMVPPGAYEGSTDECLAQAVANTGSLVREILNEVKTTGVGDNKNVLVELNIETTRHQEIQVLGNGQWSLSLGGRDCSLQMHEQKLLEVSVTQESLQAALDAAEAAGQSVEADVLRQDIKTLATMEEESERFGLAVGLDSVSTFECIVDRDKHFFMEMNTRIQVEHRVTELCYSLNFANDDNPSDSFVVDSLVEAMVLLAAHGSRLPRPTRQLRHNATVEARLNATNHALAPHAGGIIDYWSDALEGEIRDDQGISLHNPDTDVFMKYTLAGAYDSNIALLLTTGEDRMDSYESMAEVIRRTRMSGRDLATNLEFHYGLVNWFIGNNINARPTTRFIVPYLTAVGLLKQAAGNFDAGYAFASLQKAEITKAPEDQEIRNAIAEVVSHKQGLLQRPLETLLNDPHKLSGWLSINRDCYTMIDGKCCWNENPIELLMDTYHYLNMDYVDGEPAASMIWDHDDALLQTAAAFYEELELRTGVSDWLELCTLLSADTDAPDGIDNEDWAQVRASHLGFQAGVDILAVLPHLAESTGFYNLAVNPDLTINIPDNLLDGDLQEEMKKVLVPPPVANSDEILAVSGGMFYPREAPGMDEFVVEGSHFEEGDPLYIVEVMKMFNKVFAPFSGTIDKVLVEGDGVIIKKGQPLFKITPDEQLVEESPAEMQARRRKETDSFLATVLED